MRASGKATRGAEHFLAVVRRLSAAGLRVVLNVLGGLPEETRASHRRTLELLHEARGDAWLFNVYNVAPYPLTPYFPMLRDRIFDWRFANWREDAPPVFHPFGVSAQASWELCLEKVEAAHERVRARRAAAALV